MHVIARYHEIALKGRNRPFFLKKLAANLRKATADLGSVKVSLLPGRVDLEASDDISWDNLRSRLVSVFGVANFSRVFVVPRSLEALRAEVLKALPQGFSSFRVTTKRSDKTFLKSSIEIDRDLGAAIQKASGMRVSLEDPELTVFLEVLKDRILYSWEKHPGLGGFPVGSSGRVMALISGGIDSPVAAWRIMKRGCRVVLLHFHAFPLQDRTTIDKTKEIARILARYQFRSQLLLAPFGPIQQTIVASCPARLRVVLYRRFMVRIAERLAESHRCRALVTGESLGQVASQTLPNLCVIDEAAKGPVLRPLIGMDKEEITRQARTIETFDVSTLPDQDCCQLFVPKSPATAATIEEVKKAETALDVEALAQSLLPRVEEVRFEFPAPRAGGANPQVPLS